MSENRTKVLVIDDSAFNRQAITNILKDELPNVEIVGRASDGEEGLKQALFYKPDLITLDLNMPRLDGFSFLRFLMAQQPTPVIVVSSDNRRESVFQALELGALDFVVKPDGSDENAWEKCAKDLVAKIMALPGYAAKVRQCIPVKRPQHPIAPAPATHQPHIAQPVTLPQVTQYQPPRPLFQETVKPTKLWTSIKEDPLAPPEKDPPSLKPPSKLLIVGASTGGPVALNNLLSSLPYNPRVSMLIAQHMPENFTTAFAKRLNNNCAFTVREATQGEDLLGGTIYLAPGGRHMTLHRSLQNEYNIMLRMPIRIDRYTPSVDMLFESVATSWTGPLCGAVLTGMGNDGRTGAVAVTKMGGVLYAESPDSAVIFGMPKEAWEAGGAKELLHLKSIANRFADFILNR